MKKILNYLLALVLIPVFFQGCSPGNPFPHIDYAVPADYTAVPAGSGSTSLIDSIAGGISGTTPEKVLAHIWFWIHDNLKFDPDPGRQYITFEDYVRAGIYTGSASHAVIFGTLCRAKGIPCVWVNAVDDAWILDFAKMGTDISYYSGYVYLECHLGSTWKLVDGYSGSIFDEYDPLERNLPKQRYAFAKGARPYDLVMQNRPDAWVPAVTAEFSGFDISQLETIKTNGRDFLLDGFKGRRPSMGVKVQNIDSRKGVLVINAAPAYPAAKAGIEPGDIILKVDATLINDIFQLVDIIIHKGFDSNFTVTVLRNGTQTDIPVTIPAP